jgi:hypothetical protein
MPSKTNHLANVPTLGGRQADQLDVDELVHDASGVGVLELRDELALDARIAAATRSIRRLRSLEPPRETVAIADAQRVARLLKHLPATEVAERLHLAPKIVAKIARGVHPAVTAALAAQRCPTCGGKVIGPCGLCALPTARAAG